jgi:hypothetical protein
MTVENGCLEKILSALEQKEIACKKEVEIAILEDRSRFQYKSIEESIKKINDHSDILNKIKGGLTFASALGVIVILSVIGNFFITYNTTKSLKERTDLAIKNIKITSEYGVLTSRLQCKVKYPKEIR